MIRLFVAIDFPKEVKQQFADLVDALVEEGYPLVFEKKENFHLTLKFLGWYREKKIDEINKAIEKATVGVSPFWFKPTKIGYFLKESLILWVGIDKLDQLDQLAERLEENFAKIGFRKEKREFAFHITFGKKRRAHSTQKWRRMAEEIKGKYGQEFPGFKVQEIVLLESTLSREGSTYTPLTTFPLKS